MQKNFGSNDVVTQFNEVGFNPALERRLLYKNVSCQTSEGIKWKCLNINYLLADPEYETAFRADVNRVETSNRMSVPPTAEGEVIQSHEFVNVTTSMKDTLKIMLSMKF